VFLPETVRSIVGDGSVPPLALNRPVVRALCCEWKAPAASDPPRETFKHRLRRVNVFGSFTLLFEKELALILACASGQSFDASDRDRARAELRDLCAQAPDIELTPQTPLSSSLSRP